MSERGVGPIRREGVKEGERETVEEREGERESEGLDEVFLSVFQKEE